MRYHLQLNISTTLVKVVWQNHGELAIVKYTALAENHGIHNNRDSVIFLKP